MRKPKGKEAGSFPIFERQKLQRIYRQGGAIYGSQRNLVETSNLTVSKKRTFLNIKAAYAIFTPLNSRTRRFLLESKLNDGVGTRHVLINAPKIETV